MLFFQFLMLNISSIKELLHKPSEIQWIITGTLPEKLKIKFWGALSYKILPSEITKTQEIAIFGGTLGTWEPMWNWIVFYLLVKNSFNFKLGFFNYFFFSLIFIYFFTTSVLSSEKTFYIQITMVPGDTDAKKTRKTFHKLHINFFSQGLIVILHYEYLWFKTFVKIPFQGVKVEKNGIIPVIKITFSLQKNPQNYRFPWVNY